MNLDDATLEKWENESRGLLTDKSGEFNPEVEQRIITLISALRKERAAREKLEGACEKISDPRKRDHKEPDLYTENGCLMEIARAALEEARRILQGETK